MYRFGKARIIVRQRSAGQGPGSMQSFLWGVSYGHYLPWISSKCLGEMSRSRSQFDSDMLLRRNARGLFWGWEHRHKCDLQTRAMTLSETVLVSTKNQPLFTAGHIQNLIGPVKNCLSTEIKTTALNVKAVTFLQKWLPHLTLFSSTFGLQ